VANPTHAASPSVRLQRSTMRMFVSAIAVLLGFGGAVSGQTGTNLETCLTGRSPLLCNHGELTTQQRRRVEEAERLANLEVCQSGKYPALCDHTKLRTGEIGRVQSAERAQNLWGCSSGKYPALCNHALLTGPEADTVAKAERAENLKTCSTERCPVLCRHDLLSADEARTVAAAEARHSTSSARAERSVSSPEMQSPSQRAPTTRSPQLRRPAGSGCDDGHWIESVGASGKLIKLEDSSVWRVDDVDTIYTMIWLPISDVVVCGSKMINIDESETVGVTPLNRTALGSSAASTTTTNPGSIPDVVETQIDGEFKGWTGETVFVLRNGQLWQQSSYAYTYHYAYAPKVLIYRSGSGYKLIVDGVRGEISVRRLK
jgi:hypothetical protein